MKRKFIALFLLVPVLCCAGCASDAPTEAPTEAPTAALTVAADSIPAELVGTWSSASSGELDMTETFTFYDDGTFSAYAVYRDTQTQTLTGTFTVGGDADGYGNSVVYSQGGNIVIEGGFFYTNYNYRGYYYVLNQSNGNPGTITVKGGTFVNYDPSKGDDNLGGNFVADGYKVVSETKANGDVWYTVVKDTKVATADELTEAVKAGGNITLTSDISLASNDPRTAALKIPADTDVTIDLNGKTVNVTSGNFVMIPSGSKLTISGGTVVSNRYVFEGEGGEVVVNGGSYTAQETVCALFGGSTLTVNDGTFTSKDNAVVATNGSSAEGCNITINGGTFNANIFTPGYIACGIYVANKDTVNVNAGTFNIKDGVGILMRAGHTTIGKNVVINLNNTGKVTAGKIGDANINITTPSHLVIDVRSNYPGLTEGYSVTNNTAYQLVEYK